MRLRRKRKYNIGESKGVESRVGIRIGKKRIAGRKTM